MDNVSSCDPDPYEAYKLGKCSAHLGQVSFVVINSYSSDSLPMRTDTSGLFHPARRLVYRIKQERLKQKSLQSLDRVAACLATKVWLPEGISKDSTRVTLALAE
jgi:hypothetical protein